MTVDLSAFYFDIRKDALYCDPISSMTRKACAHRARSAVPLHGDLARADAVLHRGGGVAARAIARTTARCISNCSRRCRRPGATTRWPRNGARCAQVRRVVTGALEIERAQKRIGSSLEAASDRACRRPGAVRGAGRRRSRRSLHHLGGDAGRRRGAGRRLPAADVPGVAVVPNLAEGTQMRALVENLASGRRRSAISRRDAARRAGAARMGSACARRRSDGAERAVLWGRSPRSASSSRRSPALLDQATQALAAVRLRSRRRGRRAARAVLRPRADLEHRHQLRPVPAGGRARPMAPARRSRRSRWSLLWIWLARAADAADRRCRSA